MSPPEIEDEWICPDETTPGWDEIDQASWESFPASDPPSFTPTHAVTDDAAEVDLGDARGGAREPGHDVTREPPARPGE